MKKIIIINTINNIPSNVQFQDLAIKLDSKYKVIHLSDNKKPNYGSIKVVSFHKYKSSYKRLFFFLSLILRQQPDLIISNFSSNKFIDLLSFFHNFKWIATYRSAFYKKHWTNKLRYRNLNKLVILSKTMKSDIIDMYPHLRNKINIVPNSFDFKTNKNLNKDNILLHIGYDRMNSEGKLIKGTDLLFEAFNQSLKCLPVNTKLYIVGDYSKDFKEKFESSQIQFLGKISHDEVLDLMAKSKVFALPSRNEAFGQVFLEAMQNGCSLIGTEQTGAMDIVKKGKYGYIIPQEDIYLLKEAIISSFKNYKDTEDCLNYYQDKIVFFSRQNWVKKMTILIEDELN